MEIGASPLLFAQQPALHDAKAVHKPFKDKLSSEISSSIKDDAETIEIQNISYEISEAQVPGRPPEERLVVRKKVHTKQVLDEIGMEATTTVEAWPIGVDLAQEPLYAINVNGADARTVDSALVEVSRGLEEVEWWSVYRLGSGQHLFDTYVPLVRFSISRETITLRYLGFEVPPDDISDARLKEPHVVGVVTYASAERLIREALLTCDDPKQAQMLRSFAEETRAVSLIEVGPSAAKAAKSGEPSRSIKISFSQNFPSPPATQSVVIPIGKHDLDVARVQFPARLHVAAWKTLRGQYKAAPASRFRGALPHRLSRHALQGPLSALGARGTQSPA